VKHTMAITLDNTSKSSISYKEFSEYVDKSFDDLSIDSLIEIAPTFAALARNRTFLADAIIAELASIATFQESSPYSAQSLDLGGVPRKFHVRANVWLPQRELHRTNSTGEANFYSYDFAHDHNFDFLTVGYFGSGYETDIYEYQHDCVKGLIGELVDLTFLESTSLPAGKIMIYRASKDIHVQKFPKEFSISLNLLTPGKLMKDQYAFDLRTSTISSVVRSNLSGRSLLLEVGAS